MKATAAARPAPLRLRADCHVEVFPPDHVLLFTERGHQVLRGKAFVALLPLIDGTRTTDEIARDAAPEVAFAEAYYALSWLESQGVTRTTTDTVDALASTGWLDAADIVPSMIVDARIAVTAAGDCNPDALTEALAGMPVTIADRDADLHIVLAQDYLHPGLAAIDADARASGTPWLLAKPDGTRVWIGPVFSAETGCWHCLATRLREARQAETWLSRLRPDQPVLPPPASTPASHSAAARLIAIEALRWTGGSDTARAKLASEFIEIDTRTLAVERHRFARRPQCRACGSPETTAKTAIALDPRPQPLRDESADTALDRFVDPLMGPVHAVIDGLPSDNPLVHTAIARHFFPMFKDDIQVLQKNLLGRSGGKGQNAAAARTGAIGEALERYSGVWQGDIEPVLHGTAASLGVETIDLNACLLFSDAQFAQRSAWNRALRSPHQVVPAPLDPHQPIDWSPAHALSDGRTVHIPAAYCWYGHPELDALFCLADSNGCAGAGTLERAILAGLVELIERDALAIWWYNRIARPGADLASFADPYVDDLCRRYDALGRDVWAIDVTADLGLPVFVALSARRDAPVEDIVFGFGADLDARRALISALTEMNQSYGFVSDRNADGSTRYRAENEEMLDWFRTARRATHPWLNPMDGSALRTAQDYSPAPWTDATAAVHGLVDRLAGQGLDVLAIDQTRPDLGAPVARVIAPGLRHMWRRLGPGRLYDVPVALGWRDTPIAEADCNPCSIFI